MPPRYSYWTIIAGGLPTAFRAADQEDLLPTFKRIQEKHPDAEMKWFARGKLWASPEAAREDTDKRRLPPQGHRPPGGRRPPRVGEHRGRDWRPGGEHQDPRQKFIDAKKDRNQDRRKQRFDRKHASPRPGPGAVDVGPPREKPRDHPLTRDVPPAANPRPSARPATRDMREKRDWRDRPPREARDWRDRPPQQRREWQDRPPREKPRGDPLTRDVPPHSQRPSGARPPAGRAFQARPAGPKGPPPRRDTPHTGGRRPATPKPRGGGGGGRR